MEFSNPGPSNPGKALPFRLDIMPSLLPISQQKDVDLEPWGIERDTIGNVRITQPKCLRSTVNIEVCKEHSVRILNEEGNELFSNNCVTNFKIVRYDISANDCAAIVTFKVPGLGPVQMQMEQTIGTMCVLANELVEFGNNFPVWHVCVLEYFRWKNGAVGMNDMERRSRKDLEMEEERKNEIAMRRYKFLMSLSELEQGKRKRQCSDDENARKRYGSNCSKELITPDYHAQ